MANVIDNLYLKYIDWLPLELKNNIYRNLSVQELESLALSSDRSLFDVIGYLCSGVKHLIRGVSKKLLVTLHYKRTETIERLFQLNNLTEIHAHLSKLMKY